MEHIKTNESIIGTNFNLHPSVIIECEKLIIGDNVTIDERTKIICNDGLVVIGDNSFIGNDVNIILKSIEIGEYTKLHNHCLLNGKSAVKIGHNCWIGQNCVLNGEANLSIGNNVGIGTYSSIWTHGYFGELIEGCTLYGIKPTVIEDDVWLVGSYNTIFPGVTLKKKTVLFGTSVITKSTEENSTYSGNPAINITNKVGLPYKTISFIEKISIIKQTLLDNLKEANLLNEDTLMIGDLGLIYFNPPNFDLQEKDCLCFFEKIDNWKSNDNISLFCLTTKFYTKKKTKLEILVRKILNPVTARFIPFES